MFIASRFNKAPRSEGAQCALVMSVYMPLLTERDGLSDAGL
jgi:hypothetical protein